MRRLLLLGATLFLATQSAAFAASFDCAAAKAPVEKLICSDAELSDLDGRLGQAFQAARTPLDPKARDWLAKVQRTWLTARLGWCAIPAPAADAKVPETGKTCLIQLYRDRLAGFQAGVFAGPPSAERTANACSEATKAKRASVQSSQVASGQAELQECLEKAIQDQLAVIVPAGEARSGRDRDRNRLLRRSLEQLKAGYQGLMWTLHTDSLACKEGTCGPETRTVPNDLYAELLTQLLQRVIDKRNEAGL